MIPRPVLLETRLKTTALPAPTTSIPFAFPKTVLLTIVTGSYEKMPCALPVIELSLRVTPLPLGSTNIPDPTFAERLLPATRVSREAVIVIPPNALPVTVLLELRLFWDLQ